jgi:transposase-like protein
MSQGEVDVITKRFKKALVERMLGGELTHHLGYPPDGEKRPDASNHRNGTSGKTVLTDDARCGWTSRAIATGRSRRS